MAPNSKYVGDPQIRMTNLIALKIIEQGGEDPTWGTRPIDQVTIGLAIHEFASKINDEPARKAIKFAAAGLVAKNAKSIAAESL